MPEVAPSTALLRFAERQSRTAQETERRAEPRHYLAEAVVVQPVDLELRPVREPRAAVTRDISPNGIGLIFEGAIDLELGAIQLSIDGEAVCLLIEIIWRRPMEPFVYAGGRVLRELEQMPSSSVFRQP